MRVCNVVQMLINDFPHTMVRGSSEKQCDTARKRPEYVLRFRNEGEYGKK
jgi:hypothetical protein